MSIYIIVTVLVLCLIIFKCLVTWWNDRKLPPGPTGLRYLGYALFLGPRLYEEANRLSATYGDIVSIRAGGLVIVFLNSIQSIRQAFVTQGDSFSNRPLTSGQKLFNPHKLGIAINDGPVWHEHRRFALRVLKDFGVGKNIMEDFVSEEVNFIKDTFQMQIGKPFNPKVTMGKAVANVICRLVFDERTGYDDKEFEKYLKAANENLQNFSSPLVSTIVLHSLKIPFLGSWMQKNYWRLRNFNLIHEYTTNKVMKHLEQFQSESEPKDYTDAYLQEKDRLDKRDGVQSHNFTIPQLSQIVRELFLAGTDTTSTSLSWAFLLMAVHKDTVQCRVINEIQQVVGTRIITLADRKHLPYTEATINEVLRFRSIAPISLPHTVGEATTLQGYTIPSGTVVLANIYAVHRNEKLWRYPYRFEPENFLQIRASGELVVDGAEKLVSFSIGKRACLGESLARMELFLFFARLLQEFEFSLSKEQPLSLEEILNGSTGGGVWSPKDFLLDMKCR